MRPGQTLVAIAAAAVAVATLSACGSSPSPAQAVHDAGAKSEAQHTAAVNFAVTSDASGSPVTSDGTGGTDFAAKLVRGNFTINGVPGVPDGAKADGIVQGQYIYAHLLGTAAKGLAISQPWIKIDLRALGNIPGLDLGTISLAGLINPHLLFLFANSVSAARIVGPESVNGTKVTHSTATIDLNQAVKGLLGDDATTINKDLAAFVGPTFTEEVWIDQGGLIRKATFAVTVKGAKGKPLTHQTVSFEFPNYGVPVDLTLPRPDQTADLSKVLAAVAGANNGTG